MSCFQCAMPNKSIRLAIVRISYRPDIWFKCNQRSLRTYHFPIAFPEIIERNLVSELSFHLIKSIKSLFNSLFRCTHLLQQVIVAVSRLKVCGLLNSSQSFNTPMIYFVMIKMKLRYQQLLCIHVNPLLELTACEEMNKLVIYFKALYHYSLYFIVSIISFILYKLKTR